MNTNQYGVAQRGDSWKFKLINAIDASMKNSNTKYEFIKNMNELGYQVNWTDTRQHITYTTPEGMKCRDNKLFDTKYLKGEMENEFGRIKTKESIIENTRNSSTNSRNALLSNRTYNTRKYIQMEGTDNPQCTGYKQYHKRNETGFQRKSNGFTEATETGDKKYNQRGNLMYDRQKQTNFRGAESPRQENQNKIDFNRVSSGVCGIINIFSSQQVNNGTERQINRMKRSLSKQAMKEYAIKKANSSNLNWPQGEEPDM